MASIEFIYNVGIYNKIEKEPLEAVAHDDWQRDNWQRDN